jgi:hypothetical protein
MKKPNGPYRYTLELYGVANARKIAKKLQNGVEVDFSKPVTNAKTPKIYIGLVEGAVVYIGYTGQSISSRLNYGFKVNGANGYHGYKWKQKDKVELMIWTFEAFKEDKMEKDKKDNEKYKLFVEAIEAELVYLVRSKTGQWPECQNEIHFNNENRKDVLKVAEEIYETIK